MYNFGDVQRGNFGVEPVRRTEVEVKIGELKKEKAVLKFEVTRETVKDGGWLVIN